MKSNTALKWPETKNSLFKHGINIHKFGGSSLASTECILRVIDIIQSHCQLQDIIVVSANGDTTDQLISIYQSAIEQDEKLHETISCLKEQHEKLITSLLKNDHAEALIALLHKDFESLQYWLQIDISLHYADLLAFGEIWSARLLSAILNERVCPSIAIDTREFLVIDNDINCQVNTDLSRTQFNNIERLHTLAVVTGFIAKDAQGLPCTLGRNGSDYSATIMSLLTDAKNVTLWTDVDGIYSADPRVVPNARKLHRVPKGVANELGRLGNPILHAKTLKPLHQKNTHLHVASSFDANTPGTEIGHFGQIANQELSVTFDNDLILAQSDSFVGKLGDIAQKEFSAICADTKLGLIVIRFEQQKLLSDWLASYGTQVKFTPVSILAIVGHEVAKRGNIKALFKRSIKHFSPLTIVNGEHAHSLIGVISQHCTTEMLNNVHHDVTKNAKHIGLVIAGLGNIGKRFIEMLPTQLTRAAALENVHLVGLVSSKKMLIQTDGLDVDEALEQFEFQAKTYEENELIDWLTQHPYDELIVVDITPSESFSHLYHDFFERRIHIISANKWAASSSSENYNKLIATAKKTDSQWLGNTTVGAGLPINYAIDDILSSGDQITEISGIFSGTLSWLFEKYDNNQPFSTLLLRAKEDGLTEPDPREDLSGRDVQRKLLILARAAGFELSLGDIECQNLVPTNLQELSLEQFIERAGELDEDFSNAFSAAELKNSCIRYVARFAFDGNKIHAKVSLENLPKHDPFAQLTPCDNIFQIKSQWYDENPLIIRGPGAGRDVTAGGIHSDLVNLCTQLVNKQHQVKLKGIN